jgi:hypothetical protein
MGKRGDRNADSMLSFRVSHNLSVVVGHRSTDVSRVEQSPFIHGESALRHDEDLLELVVNVLRRYRRPLRHGDLDECQSVLGMGAVLDDSATDRPATDLYAILHTNDIVVPIIVTNHRQSRWLV